MGKSIMIKILKNVLVYILMLIFIFVFVFPVFWIFITSFKTRVDTFAIPPKWIFDVTVDNYRWVFESDFLRTLGNSFIVGVTSTILALVFGLLTAYGFSRYKIRGGDFLFFWVLTLRMLPAIAVAVPFFILFRGLHLLDSHIALIMVYIIFNVSFAIWLLKGFFDEIPRELDEAAIMDGYSLMQVFLRVDVPLVKSGIFATVMFCLIQSLNEFLIALSLTVRTAETAPVGIAGLQSFTGADWGKMSAAGIVFIIPVVIFTVFIRNHLVRGMSFGRMK